MNKNNKILISSSLGVFGVISTSIALPISLSQKNENRKISLSS